ncbi:MAG: FtsH protease activity modulator HflK, partial [Candidatus Omnitrophica bacterium]|nr:FtsH protease activity modulator HflK [Candidatus Omnitrophota bacterium]
MNFNTPGELLGESGKEKLQQLPDIRKYIFPAIGGVLFLLFIFSGVYSVGPDEVGVIRRFGKFVRITDPGLHFKIPLGVEKLDNVKVRYVFK